MIFKLLDIYFMNLAIIIVTQSHLLPTIITSFIPIFQPSNCTLITTPLPLPLPLPFPFPSCLAITTPTHYYNQILSSSGHQLDYFQYTFNVIITNMEISISFSYLQKRVRKASQVAPSQCSKFEKVIKAMLLCSKIDVMVGIPKKSTTSLMHPTNGPTIPNCAFGLLNFSQNNNYIFFLFFFFLKLHGLNTHYNNPFLVVWCMSNQSKPFLLFL